MKKKIFIGLITFSLCLVLGGLYITQSIDQVIVKLENIITLHQVEILRKTLLTDIKVVQQDLLLQDSPHATLLDSFVQHGEKMADSVDTCLTCHHNKSTTTQLERLRSETYLFQNALSRVYTTRANVVRREREKQVAFAIGQHIIEQINQILVFSSEKLADRTQAALESIAQTKRVLTSFVVIGPIFLLLVAVYFVKNFTGSVETLITATRKLKAGDLEYKTEGLRDEFGELGESFNDMALSLKKMIYQIEETQNRYRMLFESAGEAIFILEAEGESVGQIVSANKAAADMHGYTVDELLGLNIRDLDSHESAQNTSDRIRRMLNGEWINEEITHRKKDGSIFPVEKSAGLFEFDNRKYILAFEKDITERKQAEEALQRAEQLASVGEMAAGLAHEIKNPLAGIKVSIEVLASELELDQEDEEVFKGIINEINRIGTLLKNLLSYAKPPTPRFAPLDVNKIIEAALRAAEFSMKSLTKTTKSQALKSVDFVRELSDELPQIVADSAQLQQVILNLLLNAIYAIEEAGTISIKTCADINGFIQIQVSDTGKGFEGDDIDKIFQPFFTTKPKGTGLGLSICKRLIEQQGGTIHVGRNPERGLMFTITFPIEQKSGA